MRELRTRHGLDVRRRGSAGALPACADPGDVARVTGEVNMSAETLFAALLRTLDAFSGGMIDRATYDTKSEVIWQRAWDLGVQNEVLALAYAMQRSNRRPESAQ